MDTINKTRRRFMSMMMLVTAAIVVAALAAVYWLTYSSQEDNNRKRLNSVEEVRITGSEGNVKLGDESGNAIDSTAYVVERTAPDIGTSFSMLVNNKGQLMSAYSTEESLKQEQYQEAADIAWQGKDYDKVEFSGRMWQYLTAPADLNFQLQLQYEDILSHYDISPDEIYQIRFVDVTESRQTLQTLALTLGAIGLLLLVFFFFFSLYISKRAVMPLIEVMEKQQQFISAASHELRSPLAVMSASAGAIKKGTLEEAKEYAGKIETECTRLSRLTGDLLRIAGADSGAWQMNVSEVNPETVVIGMAERLGALAAQCGVSLEVEMQEVLFPVLHADEHRIEQLLTILIDNALGYTPVGGVVRLGTYVQRKSVYFTVADNGPGVPDEAKERIFDRFYRMDSSRTDKEHFGIGLSIAREIALLHKGSLYVQDSEGGGATFVLKIPY